jgi:hypothetical protein
MHALLLAAVLAVGSGDGRDGATDGRTVEDRPPLEFLRKGMTCQQVGVVLGNCQAGGAGKGGRWVFYDQGCTVRGIWHPPVSLNFDDKDRLENWKIFPWQGSFK